jgi:hypothetical protein
MIAAIYAQMSAAARREKLAELEEAAHMTDHQSGDGIKDNADPVRTHVPRPWRITLSRVRPGSLMVPAVFGTRPGHPGGPGAALGG